MTPATKPTTRLTFSRSFSNGRSRQIAVTVHPTWLAFRLAGTRKSYLLDVEAGYQMAAKLEAARTRAEKLKARAAAKGRH